jgi:hypothetical protein
VHALDRTAILIGSEVNQSLVMLFSCLLVRLLIVLFRFIGNNYNRLELRNLRTIAVNILTDRNICSLVYCKVQLRSIKRDRSETHVLFACLLSTKFMKVRRVILPTKFYFKTTRRFQLNFV